MTWSLTYIICVTFILTTVIRAKETTPQEANGKKTILVWNEILGQDYVCGNGFRPFMIHRCSEKNCYVTYDRQYTGGIEMFDAIVFQGPQYRTTLSDHPTGRQPFQRYVYMSIKPPGSPRVSQTLNGVFNLTISYRLDSDIVAPFFRIADRSGKIVAPALYPPWIKPIKNNTDIKLNHSKTRAAMTNSLEIHEKHVQKLVDQNISIDIYDSCETPRCFNTPIGHDNRACDGLPRAYFFNIAFEDEICKDYVGEKVLAALLSDTVPVVYGGADLSRFLPPDSYIDALKYTPRQLAELLKRLMKTPQEYLHYFWWKNHYKIVYPVHPLCKLCHILQYNYIPPKTYNNFELWWHGSVQDSYCKDLKSL